MKQTDVLHHNIWRRSLDMKDLSTTVYLIPLSYYHHDFGQNKITPCCSRGIFPIGILQVALGESASLMTIQSKLDI